MKQKWTFVMVILALALAACGLNPVEKLEEKAAEQIAEKVIEQAGGVEDAQINIGDDEELSYTITDEDGTTIEVSANDNSSTFVQTDSEGNEIRAVGNEVENPDALSGLGFDIPLPAGLINGIIQEVQENGETVAVQGIFDMNEDLTAEKLYAALHQSLTNAGFIYTDPVTGEADEPDPARLTALYTHDDGYRFMIVGGEGNALMTLSKVQK